MIEIAERLEKMLKAYAAELSDELEFDDVKYYSLQRMKHLASISDEPGYELAVEQEALNVLVHTSTTVVDAADATDAKLLAFLRGALSLGAEALKMI